MLTNNQKGRFNKQLKQHGFSSRERSAILGTLAVRLSCEIVAANEVTLGYFDVTEDGKNAVPCSDADNMEAIFCFVSKPFDNGWQLIGYPNLMIRGN
jgi:hypothetical protein